MFFLMTAMASEDPYDETANARMEIKQALAQAVTNQVPVIVVFGANWCPDCIMLDHALTKGAKTSPLARDFKIVKVNVSLNDGQIDTNLDIAASYGVPVTNGIPALVIFSPKNKVLYATKAGELASAYQMGDAGIYQFFKRVTSSVKILK